VLGRESPGEGRVRGARLSERHALAQSGEDDQVVVGAVGACALVERERRPHVRLLVNLEVGRHHADDRVDAPVQAERPVQDVRV
jgi:hypothetical protein